MSRKPSPETELRNLRRQLRETQATKDQYQREAMVLRGQLNKSQAETGEWKHRFDQLLSRAKSFDVPPGSQ
jgi:septal ring factor EnvC (AmiA/AmiB activator)